MRDFRKSLAGAALGALALASCVSGGGLPAPDRLALDQSRPHLALFEQALGEHFAGQGSGAQPPTTCVSRRPRALSADDEEALMTRFVRLAPISRCRTSPGGPVDSIIGTRADVIELYDFACTDAAHCVGWINRPGSPSTRHAMEWRDGAWHFTADRRLLAE